VQSPNAATTGDHNQRRGKYLLFFERNETSISFEGFRPRKDGNFA
jgi:hypothetical protein